MQDSPLVLVVSNWTNNAYTRGMLSKMHCADARNARTQYSPQITTLLHETLHFMHSLIDPNSTEPADGLRPRIREYLSSARVQQLMEGPIEVPKITMPNIGSGVESQVDSRSSRDDLTKEDGVAVIPEETDDVDELLMHMTLADDGQVGLDCYPR
jgi:hypothetical protein